MDEIYGESPLTAAKQIMDEYRQDQRAMINHYRNGASPALTFDQNTRLVQEIVRRLNIPRLLVGPCRIYVSQQVWDQLQELSRSITGPMPQNMTLTHFLGNPIEVSSMLPTWNEKMEIRQLDRFATYERSDMVWAEPAGLAKWIGGYCHAYAVDMAAFSSLRADFPMISCTV